METLHTLSTNSPFCWPTVPNNHHWLYVSMTLITLYCINEVSQTLWLTSFKLLILIMVLTTHEKKGKNIMLNFQYGLNIIWSYIQLAWRKPVCYLKTKPIPKEKGEIYSHNIKAIKRSIERQKCLNNLKSFDYLNVYIFKYIYINLHTHTYIYISQTFLFSLFQAEFLLMCENSTAWGKCNPHVLLHLHLYSLETIKISQKYIFWYMFKKQEYNYRLHKAYT